MDKSTNKSNTLFSLVMHLGIVACFYLFSKPITISNASMSQGMEVSVINDTPREQTVIASPAAPIQKDNPVPTQIEANAINPDIQIKDKASVVKNEKNTQLQPLPKLPINKIINKSETKPQAIKEQLLPPTLTKPTAKKIKAPSKALINDLLADNDGVQGSGKSVSGDKNNGSGGSGVNGDYSDAVINAIRPFVTIPENIKSSDNVIVRVELLPNMQVANIQFIKSSGNLIYDQNVVAAIKRRKVFPPLPNGAQFVDYRILKLTFKPE